MKNIFVINAKHLIVSVFILIFLITVCLAGNSLVDNVIETANTKRFLPIYSVETDEKKIALTFDAAWGNGK